MSAPVGTVVRATSSGVTFTKVAEGSWQHSKEEAPRTIYDSVGFAMAIERLEEIAAGAQTPNYELVEGSSS